MKDDQSTNAANIDGMSSLMPNPPAHFDVESSLSNILMKLSFKDRQAIEEEMHGVRCGAIEETPELLEMSIRVFDDKINFWKEQAESRPEEDDRNVRKLLRNVVRTNLFKTAATTATSKNKNTKPNCYLNDSDVRLRFLRAELFDVDLAVDRFVEFLEHCTHIFGDYMCEREMRIKDFTREEETQFRSSRIQYLPFRDRSGRRVLVAVGSNNFDLPIITKMKMRMFMDWTVSEDIETQRRGIVVLAWPFDEEAGSNKLWEKIIRPGIRKEVGQIQLKHNRGVPLRVVSHQIYYPDTPFFHTLNACYVYYGMDAKRKSIYKAHFGATTELLYKVRSYGIPTELLPVSCTGVVKFGHMTAWLNYVREKGQLIKNGDGDEKALVDCPRSHDVVFRKGTVWRNNTGNTFYRELIKKYSNEHAVAKKTKKCDITLGIISDIEARNGRFLEWSTQKLIWMLMKDRDRVRKKIAAAFKQYQRTRKASVERSIGDAMNIIVSSSPPSPRPTANSSSNKKRIPNTSAPPQSLQQYYSLNHVQKRQKLGSDSASTDDSSGCFGMCFHPTMDG